MNLAQQLEELRARGFDAERALTVVLIREAAIVLFAAFPDAFVLFGGANLILFQNSVRNSRDLDLLAPNAALPNGADVLTVLVDGLQALGKLTGQGPLGARIDHETPGFTRIEVLNRDQRNLFTVDLGGIAAVLNSGIEEIAIEAVSSNKKVKIRYVSRNHILLQKAEAFVHRHAVKARDAYDIKLLLDSGATLPGELENHLQDALAMKEVGRDDIAERIERLTARLCQAELEDVLPAEIYVPLEQAGFEPLREALRLLFKNWLR